MNKSWRDLIGFSRENKMKERKTDKQKTSKTLDRSSKIAIDYFPDDLP